MELPLGLLKLVMRFLDYGGMGLVTLISLSMVWVFRKRIFQFPEFVSRDKYGAKSHSLLSQLDTWIYFRLPTMESECLLRRELFKTYLLVMFKEWRSFINDLVHLDIDHMTDEEFRNKVMSGFDHFLVDYRQKVASEGVPMFVVEKFRDANKVRIDLTVTTIQEIMTNTLLPDLEDKLVVILNIFSALSANVMASSDRLMRELNGEICKVKFRGIECDPERCPIKVHSDRLKRETLEDL